MRDATKHRIETGALVCGTFALAAWVLTWQPFGSLPNHRVHKNDIVVLSPVSNVVAAEIKPGGECIPGAYPRPGHEFTILYLPNANDDPCAKSTWDIKPSRSQLTEK